MAFNKFERDRGEVRCGDCSSLLGYRIDIEPGTVTLLCVSCYMGRTMEDAAVQAVGEEEIERPVFEDRVGLPEAEED